MNLKIKDFNEINGTVKAPPSKSYSHRAVILASLANGTSKLYDVLYSEDVLASIRACEALGAVITKKKEIILKGGKSVKMDYLEVQGTGEEAPFSRKDLNTLLELGEKGNKDLIKAQRKALEKIAVEVLGEEVPDEIVIATNNAHKLEEIGDILNDLDYKIYSLNDVDLGGIEIVEDGKSYSLIERMKASAYLNSHLRYF